MRNVEQFLTIEPIWRKRIFEQVPQVVARHLTPESTEDDPPEICRRQAAFGQGQLHVADGSAVETHQRFQPPVTLQVPERLQRGTKLHIHYLNAVDHYGVSRV
jgi:hypothetical protein